MKTIFHRPKKTNLRRGLRLAGEAVELSEERDIPLTEACTIIAERERLSPGQQRALLRLAQQRRIHQ